MKQIDRQTSGDKFYEEALIKKLPIIGKAARRDWTSLD